MTPFEALREAARRRPPGVALVLGSGLGALAGRLGDAVEVPFAAVPGLDAPTVPGHRGGLMLGDWAGQRVLLFAGRLHFYEGHSWQGVTRPVELARSLGAATLLVTNAAGGIRADLEPGRLMALTGHLEWTRPACWRTPERPSPYSPRLTQLLLRAAEGANVPLATGVYAQVTGPSYETKAEIRALRAWGADAVGMSTAREVQAGADLGMECAAVSCITNKAAGLSDGPINHEEVLHTAAHQRDALARLVEAFLKEMGRG